MGHNTQTHRRTPALHYLIILISHRKCFLEVQFCCSIWGMWLEYLYACSNHNGFGVLMKKFHSRHWIKAKRSSNSHFNSMVYCQILIWSYNHAAISCLEIWSDSTNLTCLPANRKYVVLSQQYMHSQHLWTFCFHIAS